MAFAGCGSFWLASRSVGCVWRQHPNSTPSKNFQTSLSLQLFYNLAYQFIIEFQVFFDIRRICFPSSLEVPHNFLFGGLVIHITIFYGFFIPIAISIAICLSPDTFWCEPCTLTRAGGQACSLASSSTPRPEISPRLHLSVIKCTKLVSALRYFYGYSSWDCEG